MAFSRGGWSVGGGGLGWSLSGFVSVIPVFSVCGSSSGSSFAVPGGASCVVLVSIRLLLLLFFTVLAVLVVICSAIMVLLGFGFQFFHLFPHRLDFLRQR